MNRRSFEQNVPLIFEDISNAHILSIADINRFKSINDDYGHSVGDEVIILLSEILTNLFPTGDLYRLGGDEFALVTTKEKPNEIQEVIEKALKDALSVDGNEINISISVGSSYFKDSTNLEELYKQTDKKMYKAKKEYDIRLKR